MIGLETERLIFRQWKPTDFEVFAGFYSSAATAQYVGGVKTREEAWRLMASYIGHYTMKGFSYLAIDEKEGGDLIGTVGLWDSEPWPEPELGYWLLPSAQGKGYGTEAGVAVRDFARAQDFPSLISCIDPENEPSKKLALRLGATYDSTFDLLNYGPHEKYRYW